jgi:hypothetical protein
MSGALRILLSAAVVPALAAAACGSSSSHPASPVGASCSSDGDCETGYCATFYDPASKACACAPRGHACTEDPDCCGGLACRGFQCVAEDACVPAGGDLGDAGAAACCTGTSYASTCCTPGGTTCTADLQCCAFALGYGQCLIRSAVVDGAPVSAGAGACCLSPGTRCTQSSPCCGECGSNGTCCLGTATTCGSDSDCCSGACKNNGFGLACD